MSYMEQQMQSQIEGGISLKEEMDLEIHQLKAQVERLRTTLDGFDRYENLNHAYHVSPFKNEVRKVLDETPAQSLVAAERFVLTPIFESAAAYEAGYINIEKLLDKIAEANRIHRQTPETQENKS